MKMNISEAGRQPASVLVSSGFRISVLLFSGVFVNKMFYIICNCVSSG
jgi:hypothetical protein